MPTRTNKIKNIKIAVRTFFLCLCATMAVSFSLYHTEQQNLRMKHDMDLSSLSTIVHDLASAVYDPVASIRAVLSTNHNNGHANHTKIFHRFIESRNLLEDFPNVTAWTYAPMFDVNTLAHQIQKIDNESDRYKFGYGPIQVFPAPYEDRFIAPATMVAPRHLVEKVIGYNILSNTPLRETAMRALEKGTMQISQRIELKTKEPGVILFSPVYKTATIPRTPEARRQEHIGFIMTAYATQSLLASAKDKLNHMALDAEVHDFGPINATQGSELTVSSLLTSSRINQRGLDDLNPKQLIQVSKRGNNYRDIEVAGRIWRIVVQYKPRSGIINHTFLLTTASLIAGTLLSLLAAILIYFQQSATAIMATRVASKTKALRQIQSELKQSRDKAETLSLTDPLTGLSNRRALSLHFNKIIKEKSLQDHAISIAIVDIDYFKSINDTHGHEIGDAILITFADRASAYLKGHDVCLSRLGGDEFAILFCHPKGDRTAFETAQSLLQTVVDTGVEKRIPSLTASIGLAKISAKGETLSLIMKNADAALYEAKKNGRACIVRYTKSIDIKKKYEESVLKAVNEALEQDEFIPVFHPFICLKSNKLIGFEVLARWQHKTKGLLTPAAFWEALCDNELATRISIMVMQKAFIKAGELKTSGIDVGRLGINVTAKMLEDTSFAKTFIHGAHTCGLTSENLKIEVTERILLSRKTEAITNTLEELSDHGVHIAFDDFGTGFASLTHLRSFSINCVKIDRSFIQEIEKDHKSHAIVSGVIKIAHDLGLTVIAEGIETDSQKELLQQLNCDAGQGFLYGKPTDIDDIIQRLENNILIAA